MSRSHEALAAREGQPGCAPALGLRTKPALDDEQRAAADAPGGPLLILAGAGSGKTRVLTERAATLMHRGAADSSAVLAITFTNAAADELRSRLTELVGPEVNRRLTIGTFHAVCHRLVRAHPGLLQRSPRFSIYDAHTSRRVITGALQQTGLREQLTVGLVADQITRAKAHLVDAAGYAGLAHSSRARQIAETYARYEASLADSDALDLDDLLRGAVTLLEDPVLLERYRARWRAILVDEYQDTNPAQEAWLTRLAGEQPNLTVVGDPEQAIYAFRSADVSNILGFEQRYAGARVVALRRNYRSSAAIVRCAARLACHGTGGARVRMWTDASPGTPVTVAGAEDERAEAQQAAIWCRRLLDAGTSPAQIAVLVRTRAQAGPIEDGLLLAGVACRVLGARGLWETAAVRDLVAHLALLANPRDQQAASRALSLQPGVGAVAIARVLGAAEVHDGDLLATCSHADAIPRLNGAQRRAVQTLGRGLSELGAQLHRRGVAATVRDTVTAIGLVERQRERGEQGEEQLEALRRVCRAATQYQRQTERPSLTEFLGQGMLGRDDQQDAPGVARVTLCTLHAAKGAEWDHVRIAGLCEGLLPHQRAIDAGQVDEERRLAYVGMTRARHELRLTWPRRLRGRPTRRSRFIREAGIEHATDAAQSDDLLGRRAA